VDLEGDVVARDEAVAAELGVDAVQVRPVELLSTQKPCIVFAVREISFFAPGEGVTRTSGGSWSGGAGGGFCGGASMR